MEEINRESIEEPLKLKIDAHVVTQLGAELITGPEIALVELIKNSYDADASYCFIDIDPDYKEVKDNKRLVGKITIKDNGHGMNRAVINKSWLTISHSEKRLAKHDGKKTTKYDRSYTGDKGLGRLGSMQLGDLCRIKTHDTANEHGIEVAFCWSDFKPGVTLDSVKIESIPLAPEKKPGTEIEIVGLKDLDYWKDEAKLTKLKYKLSSMVSPFGHLKKFSLYLTIAGVDNELETFNDKIYNLCSSEYSFSLKDSVITVTGSLKLNNFEPASKIEKEYYEKYILADDGLKLFEYLSQSSKLSDYIQKKSENNKYQWSFEKKIDIKDVSATKNRKIRNKNAILNQQAGFTHPGDFDGEIFQFTFKKDNLDIGDENLNFTDTKSLIQALTGGVAAYRDGFKIGSKNTDWLGLSSEMTSGSGGYSLRPANVAGYINLTWDHNKLLREKSDRESFVDNDAYLGFWIVCQEIIGTINTFRNSSRRVSLEFLKQSQDFEQGKPQGYSAEHAIYELEDLTIKAKAQKQSISKNQSKIKAELNDSVQYIEKTISNVRNSLVPDPKFDKEMTVLRDRVRFIEEQFYNYSSQYDEFTNSLANHFRSIDRIKDEISGYEQQISDFYDHVAIGVTAEDLAHDANSQISNISLHLNAAINIVKKLGIKDKDLMKHLLSIKGDTRNISKSLSSLNPLVRAQRDVVEDLDLLEQIKEYFSIRENYFVEKSIAININALSSSRRLKFNRGKLFQVIDNLVRNSEHWLEVYKTHYPEALLEINIDFEGNKFVLWDNGRGIREGIESSVFDMFVTDKERGQGLGLFIVNKILTEKGCSVYLLQEKNSFGRRYKFKVDLTEAMD